MKISAHPKSVQTLHKKEFGISTWSVPFGGLQADFIVWKYKRLFPNEVLADRITLWPTGLAKAFQKKYHLIDMDKVKAAAMKHESERQNILNQMRKLIVRKQCDTTIGPLKLLELHEDKKFRAFRKDMNANYRHMRKYFPWLLPKRKYKSKKKSTSQIQRRHHKKKLAKQSHFRTVSFVPVKSNLNKPSMLTSDPWWKQWNPLMPNVASQAVSYISSGSRSNI